MNSFLQSPEWQEVQERLGRQTLRIGSLLVIRHRFLPGLSSLYTPRPSVFPGGFWDDVRRAAASGGDVFCKADPAVAASAPPQSVPASSLQPAETLLVGCNGDDAALLSAMHPKTRYNIRLAERHGVVVRSIDPANRAAFETFLQLLRETARRERFSLHPLAHYRALAAVQNKEFANVLFTAEFKGWPLAAAFVNFYRPTAAATYLHGGSTRTHRNLMAPHLLHWRIIQAARKRGCALYDLGGVDAARWPGLTRFKEGFGGRVVVFPPSYDVVFRPLLYRYYRLQRTLRGRP